MSTLTPELLEPFDRACREADGVAPFGEQAHREVGAGAGTGYLVWDPEGQTLRGACHVGADGTWAELAVHPAHRRRGIGRHLAELLARDHPGARAWAHGGLPEAAALARAAGAVAVRELVHMTLPAAALAGLPAAELPAGFAARPYTPADDEAWLAVNARAFARHPEQGRVDAAALAARTAEPWFDPEGFLLVEDMTGPRPRLAAFHWTKRVPGTATGEVYVVGVDPADQGRGLGRPVTLLGLEHLRSHGAREVELYVEGDNAPALRTYARLGFTRDGTDVMYARPQD